MHKIALNRNTLLLSFTLLVVMLGYGMIQPVIPFLITQLGASGRDMGLLASIYAAMQLVCAPLWGTVSDRVGRRPVLLVGVLGYAITMVVFGLATQFWMLFVARMFSGVLGSAAMPTALAYLSDNLPEKERGGAMGQLGASMGLGVVLGPLLGGLLSSDWLALPFFVGAGLALFSCGLVWLLLPESHLPQAAATEAQPAPFWRRANLQRILLSPAGRLLGLIFILSFGMTNFQGIIGLYVLQRLEFNTQQVGAIWMVAGAMMVVGQGALSGRLGRRFGDLAVVRGGLLAGALGFGGMLLAKDFPGTLLAAGFLMLAVALIGPALNSHLSAYGGEHQGALMGLNTAVASLGRIVGPLWAGFSFDINMSYPFISGGLVLLAGFAASLLGMRAQRNNELRP